MKAFTNTLLFVFGSLLVSSPLSAFTEIADGALKFTADTSILWDSNYQGNANGDSDTVYSITPGFSWDRSSGRIKMQANASIEFQRLKDNDQYDDEYINANFSIKAPFAPGSPMSGQGSLAHNESSSIDESLNQRISRETSSASMSFSYRFRPKISANLNAAYIETANDEFSTITDHNLALGATWHDIWRDVSLSLDYRLRNAKSSGAIGTGAKNKENSFSASLDGQLLPKNLFPKLEATLAFRLQSNSSLIEDEADKQILGFQAGLHWPARETTTLNLTLDRDLQLSADDRTNEITRLNFGVVQQIGRKITTRLDIALSDTKTLSIDRSSTRFTAELNATYQVNRYLNLNAQASWSENYSSQSFGDYTRSIIQLGATFRY